MKYIFYNLFKVRGCETNENYLRRAWWKKGQEPLLYSL